MEALIVIGAIVVLMVWFIICKEFYNVAEAKGYPQMKYLWLTFFFGVMGALLIIALPDKSNTTAGTPDTDKNNGGSAEAAKGNNDASINGDFNNMSNLEKLEYYKKLLDNGKITEEEFIQMRKTLIGE